MFLQPSVETDWPPVTHDEATASHTVNLNKIEMHRTHILAAFVLGADLKQMSLVVLFYLLS